MRRIERGLTLGLVATGLALCLSLSRAAPPAHGFLLAPPRLRVEPIPLGNGMDNVYVAKFDPLRKGVGVSLAPVDEACRAELERLEASGEGASAAAADLLDYYQGVLMWEGLHVTPEARAMAARAVALREADPRTTPFQMADSLSRRALTLAEAGDYAGASADYARALELYECAAPTGGSAPLLTRSRLAAVWIRQGKYAEARSLVDGIDASNHRVAILAKASVLTALGDYEVARELLTSIVDEIGPEKRASALANLAIVEAASGDGNRALELAQEAVTIDETILRASHPARTASTYNLALILARNGRHAEARRLLEELVVIQERALGPTHPDLALTLLGLANLDVLQGDLETARTLYERVLPLQRRVLSDRDQDLPFTLASAAWFYWNVGEKSRAVDLSLEAERLARSQFRASVRGLSEREALRYEAIRTSGLDIGLSCLAGQRSASAKLAARVWNEIVQSRALVLDEMARRARSSRTDRAATELARSRRDLSQLVNAAASGDDPPSLQAIAQARERKEGLERKVAKVEAESVPAPPAEDVCLERITRSLPNASALVAYVSYARLDGAADEPGERSSAPLHFGAFILDSSRKSARFVALGPARDVDALVGAWHDAVAVDPRLSRDGPRRAEERYIEASRALAHSVWEPVARLLQGCRRVFVVPDGSLHGVNLATLPSSSGRYLVEEDVTFHYLSAERDLTQERRPRTGSGALLAVAPSFDSVPERVLRARNAAPADGSALRGSSPSCGVRGIPLFSPLLSAEEEARTVASLWQDRAGRHASAHVLVGAQADELEVKEIRPDTRVLHIATHGFHRDEHCVSLLSELRVPTRGGDASGVIAWSRDGDSPLLLSGLAMAGANRMRETAAASGEDGILTAEEIASIDLTHVDWVVLSGCETGVGEPRVNEGVLGLQRAFRIAGAASLIMSLFPVQDEGARLWMAELYRARLSGLSTADSVRQADRRYLAGARAEGRSTHPFFWGAFVSTGAWR